MNSSTIVLIVSELIIWGAYLWPWYNIGTTFNLGGLPFFYWWPLLMFPVTCLLLLTYTFVSEKGKMGQ